VNLDDRDEGLDAALRALGEDARITHSKAELDEVSAAVLARMNTHKPARERDGDQPVVSMPVRRATHVESAASPPRVVWLSIIIVASVLVGAVAGMLAWIGGSTTAAAVTAAGGAFAATMALALQVMHLVGDRTDAE
jgi:hypothetical protein